MPIHAPPTLPTGKPQEAQCPLSNKKHSAWEAELKRPHAKCEVRCLVRGKYTTCRLHESTLPHSHRLWLRLWLSP